MGISVEVIVGRPFRVVTIEQLQLLQGNSRQPGRVLGRRVQPSEKKKERYFSGFQNPEGSREIT